MNLFEAGLCLNRMRNSRDVALLMSLSAGTGTLISYRESVFAQVSSTDPLNSIDNALRKHNCSKLISPPLEPLGELNHIRFSYCKGLQFHSISVQCDSRYDAEHASTHPGKQFLAS